MATNNNIQTFTAADIEKYHKGLLSPKERHDLEKAALDDPFIADALEGYAAAGNTLETDLAELKGRLAQKVEGAKVIPLSGGIRKPIPWLRIAALIVIIAGTAVLANEFIFTGKKTEIAKTEIKDKENVTTADTISSPATSNELTPVKNDEAKDNKQQTNNGTAKVTQETTVSEVAGKDATATLSKADDSKYKAEPVAVTTSPGATMNTPATGGAEEKLKTVDKEIKRDDTKALVKNERKPDSDADGVKDQFDKEAVPSPQKKSNPVVINRNAADEKGGNAGLYNNANTFRGRVTDSNNVGVPFANVTNTQDNNAGTYTDARGYFNLTYPDTVLNVQVRSIGFENNNVQLRNNVSNNQVIMQDDRRSLSEVVISNQKPNVAARSRDNNMKLEEPEPADGWENYDAYLANNLNAPEEVKTKQNTGGQVQVSFEVNKQGEPVNIKIEKSLCGKCDKEAVRLIKEGPKWRRNANKKGRTTVTINF